MKDRILKVIEALRKFDPGRASELQTEFAGLPEDKQADFLVKVTEAATAAVEASKPDGAKAAAEAAGAVLAQAKEALAEVRRLQGQALVDRKLAEARLPKPAETLAREHLGGRTVEEAEVDAEVKRVREAFAAMVTVGRIAGSVVVGQSSPEKIQAGCDAMLGVKEALKDSGVRAFRGLKELWAFCHGGQVSYEDFLQASHTDYARVAETIVAADFPQILKNSMTKRLLQDYAEVGMGGLEQLISETEVDDFKTQERVRMGYLGDLPTVAENAGYTELTKPTDEIISFAVTKRGGFLDVTWETILNDDLGKIRDFPSRQARAARRTLKQFITDFFVTNPAYDADAVAWFHATHSNLGSVALSVGELNAREIALAKQTEKDSAKRLGLPLQWLMVAVDLKAPAFAINNSQIYNPGPSIEEANPWYQRFGAQGERIIVNELPTDANDWWFGSLPSEAPFLEVAYLRGFRAPQLFMVPIEERRKITAIDKLQFYVVHVYGGDIVDFRSVGKNVVV